MISLLGAIGGLVVSAALLTFGLRVGVRWKTEGLAGEAEIAAAVEGGRTGWPQWGAA